MDLTKCCFCIEILCALQSTLNSIPPGPQRRSVAEHGWRQALLNLEGTNFLSAVIMEEDDLEQGTRTG
jgi:hypothetical protein